MRLVLASGSPRRAAVLRQLGLEPEVRPPDLDESYLDRESPSAHVERLAQAKARAIATQEPDALVVAGDTVVLLDGVVLGKPADADEAVGMLTSLAGRTHVVLSGLALAGPHGVVSGIERTEVRMRSFGKEAARRYVDTGEPLDKAGAYGIQGLGAALVGAVQGDYYSVMGFPVGLFADLLERAGWRYDFGSLTRSNDEPASDA